MTGSLSLPDAADLLDLDMGTQEDTVGGWVTAQLGRLPIEGDEFEVANHHVTILAMTKRRVARVRFAARPPAPETDA
jgi:CBS domain containing-hemolysin-like protein